MVSDGGRLVAAAEGEYEFVVECRDAAGNSSTKSVGVALDRSLGFPTATPGTLSPNGDGVNDTTTLGFKLTRSASVRIAVKVDGKTVRAFELGSQGAGSHTVVWDGANGAGEPLGSSRPSFTVTASSALGTTSISGSWSSTLRPRLGAGGAGRLAGQDGSAGPAWRGTPTAPRSTFRTRSPTRLARRWPRRRAAGWQPASRLTWDVEAAGAGGYNRRASRPTSAGTASRRPPLPR